MNPAIDEALSIEAIALGETNRCALDMLDPGGKGINVSRVVHRLGHDTVALGFAGGVTGALLRARLDEEGVRHELVEVAGFTRINVMLYERGSGRRTRMYLPGAAADVAQLALLSARLDHVQAGELVVLAGSLPPGVAASAYGDLCRRLHTRGIAVIVDASGEALRASLDAQPLLIKPDIEEACEFFGRALESDAEVVNAANELRARGPRCVVISLGARGAIGVGPDGAWKAVPPPVEAQSTVGSGDSMVAGLAIALAEGSGLEEGLRLGTAAGAATAMRSGTLLCLREDVEGLRAGVAVTRL